MKNGIAIAVLCFGTPLCMTAYSGEIETVEDILAREPKRSDYGSRSVQCINPRGIGKHEVSVSNTHLTLPPTPYV